MAKLSTTTVVKRAVLKKLGAARLKEARALAEANCHAGAVYLGGYAVECYLKAAICRTLDCNELPATFMSHNLGALLLHAGLRRKISSVPQVQRNLAAIQGTWAMEGAGAIRYQAPDTLTASDAEDFLKWVAGRNGVVPWLKKQV